VFYCDKCPSRKANRGATEEGARSSAICHLAIQHHELRGIMLTDDRLDSEFIKDVYWVSCSFSIHDAYDLECPFKKIFN
jgi:hypothetical protein